MITEVTNNYIPILTFLSGVIISIISFFFTAGRFSEKLIGRVDSLEKNMNDTVERVLSLEEQNHDADVRFARILTKLEDISSRMLDLKNDFRGSSSKNT
jgi:hypothetical protein